MHVALHSLLFYSKIYASKSTVSKCLLKVQIYKHRNLFQCTENYVIHISCPARRINYFYNLIKTLENMWRFKFYFLELFCFKTLQGFFCWRSKQFHIKTRMISISKILTENYLKHWNINHILWNESWAYKKAKCVLAFQWSY